MGKVSLSKCRCERLGKVACSYHWVVVVGGFRLENNYAAAGRPRVELRRGYRAGSAPLSVVPR